MPLENKRFLTEISGKLVEDKGYISKRLFEHLFVDGIQLITKLKNNMKGAQMSVAGKILLRKRVLIETINDELKNMEQVEHSKHRTFHNFFVNLMAGWRPIASSQRNHPSTCKLCRITNSYSFRVFSSNSRCLCNFSIYI